jgi:chromosome segregation ATPase
MGAESEPAAGVNKPQRSASELRTALEDAERRLQDLKRRKKDAVAGFNEQIKDQEAEIEGILEQLETMQGG